ncbi:ABC transporter permease [Methanocella conradii]|uniref:ABC transporter permease n=1 Tax=Methanocella conradii TaxID=1175444 RepID=UPI0024B36DE6|nr:ABC transporter permease [Methanocella conradii]MDI6897873.1 ABC transporter permease [Methanocella conradii]
MANNTLIIAKKELDNLLNSRFVILVLVVYIFLIILKLYSFYDQWSSGYIWGSILQASLDNLLGTITLYSQFVAVIIGFSAVSSETSNNALSTLIVKPLYRDTIINGKLIGAFGFIACIVGLVIMFYISGLLLLCGNYIAPVLQDFLIRAPLVLVISIIYTMVFLSLSMLISITLKNQAFALTMSVLTIIISDLIVNVNISGNIMLLFGGNEEIAYVVSGLSPSGILGNIFVHSEVFNPAFSVVDAIHLTIPHLTKLIFYVGITIIAAYSIFMRRDI